MNVNDPKLTAYALDELDESERSAIRRATADSGEAQQFIAETQALARALRSQYRLELKRELVAPEKIAASKKPGAEPLPSLHSSKFAPVPEPTIRIGIIGMTSAVLELLKK